MDSTLCNVEAAHSMFGKGSAMQQYEELGQDVGRLGIGAELVVDKRRVAIRWR